MIHCRIFLLVNAFQFQQTKALEQETLCLWMGSVHQLPTVANLFSSPGCLPRTRQTNITNKPWP